MATVYDLDDPSVLLSVEVIDDPRPFYDQLRREAPVWQVPGQDTFVVSDPDLIRDAVGRTSELSSNLVSLLHRDESGGPTVFELAPLGDPIHVLATADPPSHTAQRKLLLPHLTPRAVAAVEPTVRTLVDQQLEPMLDSARGEIVHGLANPLPARLICDLVGLPPAEADRIVPLVVDTGPLLDGVADLDTMGRAGLAALEMTALAQAYLEAGRDPTSAPRTGLLGVLLNGIDHDVVTPDQARDILVQLFNAGTETTSSLIATAIETLARRPDLQAHLRSNPDAIPAAIEELLRDDGPFQFHYRWATGDVTLGESTIPVGSRVLLMWAAANRPAPDAEGAAPSPAGASAHYAFGRGAHFCIGAHLARLEGRVVLEQVLAATASVTLDPESPPVRRPSIFLRRWARLPVVFEAPDR